MLKKTFSNEDITDAKRDIPDLQVYGNGDLWQCLYKVFSQSEGWMKSTKVMEIPHVGCLVQITTQIEDDFGCLQAVEALTFVPGVEIALCGTKLIKIHRE